MQFIDAKTVAGNLPYKQLIKTLREAFKEDINSPGRTHHKIDATNTLLLMPAWSKVRDIGIKIVSVFPENAQDNLSAVNAKNIRKARLFQTTEIIIFNLSGLLTVKTDCVTNSAVRQI